MKKNPPPQNYRSFTLVTSGFKTLLAFFALIVGYGTTTAQTWHAVDHAGFTGSPAWMSPQRSLAIDATGSPFIVYEDSSHSLKATVMKYNGGSWVSVGSPGFSAARVSYTAIALDGGGTPYVAFVDSSYGNKASVMMA